jgi:hypothetical protein
LEPDRPYRHHDGTSADGVDLIRMKGGASGSSVLLQTKNVRGSFVRQIEGHFEMPIGIGANLDGTTRVTMQLFGSDVPTCFSRTLDRVTDRPEDNFFRATN